MSEQLSQSETKVLETPPFPLASLSRMPTTGFEDCAPAATFGLGAVYAADDVAEHLLESAALWQELALCGAELTTTRPPDVLEESIEEHDYLRSRKNDLLHENLAAVRQQLNDFSLLQRAKFDAYLDQNIPDFLREAKEQSVEELQDWASWLVAQEREGVLINILQWHAYTVGEQAADETVQELVDGKKTTFKQAVRFLAEVGVLAPSAVQTSEQVDDIDVVIGDTFDMRLKERVGYYQKGTQQVDIEQGVGRTLIERHAELLAHFDYTLFHEWAHATLAMACARGEMVMSAVWLNEALTEQVAIAIELYEKRVYPRARSYQAERELLRVVLRFGTEFAVPETLATRAYSGDEEDYRRFAAAVDAAWSGCDILAQVTGWVESSCRPGMSGDVVSRMINQIRQTLLTQPEDLLDLQAA